ncbi:MAG: ABC-F family ATP-binding cassette domain-containing protein [Saprospiraceae bacterium]|nr:ABC-F family ATP-binding cassette domain-containing protein [Saprospiraceae bacterium]
MNYLTLENVTKSYGEKILFKNVFLQIGKGEKIALVAKNGSGKSTLLSLLAGIEKSEGETSKIIIRKGIRIGFLTQEPEFDENSTVLEAIFDSENPLIRAVKEYEDALLHHHQDDERLQKAMSLMDDLKAWDTEHRAKEILSKLNIVRFDQVIKTLSGGQKKRLALAKVIIDEPDFLILDEPTNHLDVEMIEWLEDFLTSTNLTLFMVTHDRYFLERVCDSIVELDRGAFYRYKGSYSDYLEKKAIRVENESIALDKDKKLFGKELEWVRKQPKARTTKAKSRVDAFEDIKARASKRLDNERVQIEIRGSRLGSKILEAEYISKKYGDNTILTDFAYKFKQRERVGIVGPNGVGKSTFLRLLTQQEKPDAGKIVKGETVIFGYYTQDGIQLKDDKRVIDVVQSVAEYIPLEKGQKITAAQLLDRFLFSREQQQVYVSQLSGGERRRLYLLTILMTNPNFLILDEPTNDLDIITLNVLEDFLLEFQGCLLIVTHDRYFMDKLVDHLFVFEGNGNVKDFNGTYSDYREWKILSETEGRAQKEPSKITEVTPSEAIRRATQQERKELQKIEKEIKQLEEKKVILTDKFNDISALTQAQITQFSEELASVNTQLELKEMRWFELSEMS